MFIFFKKGVIIISLLIFLILGGFSFVSKSEAAFNEQINYQGKLTDNSDMAVTDGAIHCLKFRLMDAATNGNELWAEEWDAATSKITTSSGLFSVLLGTYQSLSGVNFNQTSIYLEVQYDPGCDDTYEEVFSPRKRIGAIPAAFEAKQLGGKTWAVPDAIGSTTPNTGAFTTLSSVYSGASAALTVTQSSTGNIVALTGDAITTGTGLALSIDGLTTGTGLDITSTSTAGGASGSSKMINVTRSGANSNASHTAYGLYSAVTNTGTTSTNIAGYFSASGATNNYGLIVENGNVGVGATTPGEKLEVVGNIISKGTSWTIRTSAADNPWNSVTYGNGLFVAVAVAGTGNNQVMTSPDGINWTARTSATNNMWNSVTYGNGFFVAVSENGTGNRVMTSPDGITWTSRTSAANNSWRSVTYGNGLFVAVSDTGTGNRVMTSPDGITWTSRTSAADNSWRSVTYGNGLFVAVASGVTGDQVMTSPDGINWTSRTSATNNMWNSVTYGNGLFVAVSITGTGNRVMTSPDGITWTSRTSAADNEWRSVAYGNGLFVAVSSSVTGDPVMTSPDGITWTSRTSAANNLWFSVTYGNGLFAAVAWSSTGNRAMTSGKQDYQVLAHNNTYQGGMNIFGNVGIGTTIPDKTLEINAATGGSLRLTYNDNNGSATDYTDLTVGSDGDLTITTIDSDGTAGDIVLMPDGNIGISYATPATKLDVDTGSNTDGLRLRGTAETAEIVDMYVDSAGQFVLSTVAGTDTAGHIDFRSEDDEWGFVLRESDGTGTATYSNFYVVDAATDYMNIIVNATQSTTGLVITDDDYVGIGTITPTNKLTVRSDSTGASIALLRLENLHATAAIGTGGTVDFYANRTTGGSTQFTSLESVVTSIDNTYYSGKLNVKIASNGSLVTMMEVGNPNIVMNRPLEINVAGNTGISYDLNFLNTGISQITSEGPLLISAGDGNHNENLTITTGSNVISGDSGIATAGAATTLTDSAKAWTADEWIGGTVTIIGGSGAGQVQKITDNTTTVITVADWDTTLGDPAANSIYHLAYARGGDIIANIQNSDIIFGGFKVAGMDSGGYIFRISPTGDVEIGGNGSGGSDLIVKQNITLTGGNITIGQLDISNAGTPSLTENADKTGSANTGCNDVATYYYKVTALNDNGETTGSTEATITTGAASGTYANDDTITITWNAVPGATKYKVHRSVNQTWDAGADDYWVDKKYITSPTTHLTDNCQTGDDTANDAPPSVNNTGGNITYPSSNGPKKSIVLTAAGAIIPTTNGAAQTKIDGTNHTYYVLDFDASTDESAYWQWTMPDSYNGGTIDITYYWEAASITNEVGWCYQAVGIQANNTEDIDPPLSSAVCEVDTAQGNANDLASVTESAATSNFAAGDYVSFKVFRDADESVVGAGNDDMAGDARLVKVKIEYSINSESD